MSFVLVHFKDEGQDLDQDQDQMSQHLALVILPFALVHFFRNRTRMSQYLALAILPFVLVHFKGRVIRTC